MIDPNRLRAAIAQFRERAGLAYYAIFLGPRGFGRPSSVENTDRQYRTKYWDVFDSVDEMPRYAVIASYIRNYPRPAAVLDVGCGYGRLMAEIDPSRIASYLGIDQSQVAIDRAQAAGYANASFETADFTAWPSAGRFDLVVLNDTLYYARHPIATLDRYFDMLSDGGVVIVAMFRHRNTMTIWKNIEDRFHSSGRVEVRNGKGEVTDIRIIEARRAPSRSREQAHGSAAPRPQRADLL